ncbi:MAG: inosine monophosphate cyclohydrolase [Clostridia bacterium]|nr:inosine monophosphate cyclohydrolase [Clostridia bacterium]
MKILNIGEELRGNAYPGRGILLGRSADGKSAVAAYFIMGRSGNSRNRIFAQTEDGIRTEAFDPSKMVDPSLIIYHPVRLYDGRLIVTNGDQTDTIWEGMKRGEAPEAALRTREFEPDEPNYTPRISGVIERDGAYQLSILKSFEGDPACCKRFFFEYDKPVAGLGHFIHTYQCDGDPLPSFEGEPKTVRIEGDAQALADMLWEHLNPDNKVSLYVRYTDLTTGACTQIIRNKNQ